MQDIVLMAPKEGECKLVLIQLVASYDIVE